MRETQAPELTAAQTAIIRRAAAAGGCYTLDNPMTLGVGASLERAGLGLVIGRTFQLTETGRSHA